MDPNLLRIEPLRLPDPMEGFNSLLTGALNIEKLAGARREEMDRDALNASFAKATKNGVLDRPGLVQNIAETGQGHAIPGLLKGFGEIDKINAETKYKKAETILKKAEQRKELWKHVNFSDPHIGGTQALQLIEMDRNDPDIIEYLRDSGTDPDKLYGTVKADLMKSMQDGTFGKRGGFIERMVLGLDNIAKQKTMEINRGDKIDIVQVPENTLGTAAPKTAGSYSVGLSPNRQHTSITINNEAQKAAGKFMDTIGEGLGKEYLAQKNIADRAGASINEIRRLRDLTSKAITGTGAGTLEAIAAAAEQAQIPVVSKDVLQATQELRMGVARIMLVNIGKLREEEGVRLGSVTEKEFDQLMASAPKMTDRPEVIDAWLGRAENALRNVQTEFNAKNEQLLKNPATAGFGQMVPMNNVPVSPPAAPTGRPARRETPEDLLRRHSGSGGGSPGGGEGGGFGGGFDPAQSDAPVTKGTARWSKAIEEASAKTGVPVALLHAVMTQESGGNEKAISPMGAIGLMQLMPGTAAGLRVNPRDPAQNVLGGAMYLRKMYDHFGDWKSAIAAYNAGPGALRKSKQNANYQVWEAPYNAGYAETRNYVKNIMGNLARHKRKPVSDG